MKENTIKKFRRVIHAYKTDSHTDIDEAWDSAVGVIESLARRVRKLEQAAKADWNEVAFEEIARLSISPLGGVVGVKREPVDQPVVRADGSMYLPNAKLVREEYPRVDTNVWYTNNMSVDVMLTLSDCTGREFNVIGYWTYRQKDWMMYDDQGNGVKVTVPVKSWRYIEPATPQPAQPAREWISVSERLPGIGRQYRNLSDNVLVVLDGNFNENIYIGYIQHHTGQWSITGASGNVTHWQYLPEPPQ